jgi:cysteine desulfurase/selenocysteine lyase
MINPEQIKKDFPIFGSEKDLVFLDNASTTQKPARVLEAERHFYESANANIHRGVYGLAERADKIYGDARNLLADFAGANGAGEAGGSQIIFTKNATEAANLLAFSIGESLIRPGDNVVVTELEHHANYLPWQEMAKRKKADFRVIPITGADGTLDLRTAEKMIDSKTKVVAMTQMSNVLGVMTDVEKFVELAHRQKALLILDAAQCPAHRPVNFSKLKADAAFFTGHKIYGPMGTGVLYLTAELAEAIPPFLTGGGMIEELPDHWLEAPEKFEAGTPNVAGIAGLAEAINFIKEIGLEEIAAHEKLLSKICRQTLATIPEVKLFGPEDEDSLTSIVSFDVAGVHPHDLASILAEDNICIRAGHHCAKPLLNKLGKNALARVSFGIYNQVEDLERLKNAILKAIKIFK